MKIQIKDYTIKQNPIKGSFDFRAIQEGSYLRVRPLDDLKDWSKAQRLILNNVAAQRGDKIYINSASIWKQIKAALSISDDAAAIEALREIG